jgi:hypothetical protein
MGTVHATIHLTEGWATAKTPYNEYLGSGRDRAEALANVIEKMRQDGQHGTYTVTGDAYWSGRRNGSF